MSVKNWTAWKEGSYLVMVCLSWAFGLMTLALVLDSIWRHACLPTSPRSYQEKHSTDGPISHGTTWLSEVSE